MKCVRGFVLTSAVFLFAGSTWAQSSGCLGTKQGHPHPYGNFDFETSSYRDEVAKLPDVRRATSKYGIVSCVTNPSQYRLRVNWLVPGPDGWVAPNDIKRSVPRFTDEDKDVWLNGCLMIGMRGDTTHARFLALEEDRPVVAEEQRRGCREVILGGGGPRAGKIGEIGNILVKFSNAVPSNADDPEATMLQFDGTVEVLSAQPDRYTSRVDYEVKPIGKEAILQKVTMRPVFRGDTEVLLPAFNKQNPSVLKIDSKGTIQFDVVDVVNPRLAYASYELLDQTGQPVGSIPFPVFVPSRQ